MEEGKAAYPNARYVTGSTEYDFWAADERLSGPTENAAKLVQSNVVPLAEQITFIGDHAEVVPGINGLNAFGHTPGHMAYLVESDGKQLLIWGDVANHYVMSVQRPDWHVSFDADKETAAATRKRLFDGRDRPHPGHRRPYGSPRSATSRRPAAHTGGCRRAISCICELTSDGGRGLLLDLAAATTARSCAGQASSARLGGHAELKRRRAMRPAALSMAVLLGIATLGGAAQAQATPTLSATVVIESGRTVHVGGKRHHSFQRGPTSHWHKGFTNHQKRWRAGPPSHRHKFLARPHKRWHDGRHHRPVWAKRFHQPPVVIVKPAHGRWLGHRHLPARPLIRNGSFARGPHHW